MNDDSLMQQGKHPEKRRGDRRRARTRADILAAARQVFAQRGYHDASIAEITEQADVAVGTFYLYFRNKDEAFATVMEEGLRETVSLVKQALFAETGERSLAVVVRAIFRHAYQKRDLFRVAIMAGAEYTRISHVQDAIEEVLLAFLETALTDGEQANYDLPLVARLLGGMILQGIMWWFEQEQPDPDGMAGQLLALLQGSLPRHVVIGRS
ncbi:MAG TPA: TetR/AcrR family transcriptional regulator [Ktedonobacteraceae bacterium]